MANSPTWVPPEPPPPGAIVTLKVPATTWYRVHNFDQATGKYAPVAFNDSCSGNARFSPLFFEDKNQLIPTLYAAASTQAAIAEVILRNAPTPSVGYLHDLRQDLDSNLHLSALQAPTLTLANLTTTGMQAAGLEPYALVSGGLSHYHITRRWGRWIWETQPDTQGLLWMSRRYNRDAVIMLFGDRFQHGELTTLGLKPIAEYTTTIVAILNEMGAGIMPDL